MNQIKGGIRWWICLKKVCQEHAGMSSSGSQEGLIARPSSSWGVLLLVDVQGFQYSSLPVVFFHFSCLGGLPVHLVLVGPSMGCNPIVGVVFLHCILVLTWALLKGPTDFPDVHTLTVLARYFIDTFLPPVFWGCFTCTRALLTVLLDLQTASLPMVDKPFRSSRWVQGRTGGARALGGVWLVWEECNDVGWPLRFPFTMASG